MPAPSPNAAEACAQIESPTALGANIGVDLPTLICGVQPLAVVHYIVHYSELARVATSAKRLLPSNSVKFFFCRFCAPELARVALESSSVGLSNGLSTTASL